MISGLPFDDYRNLLRRLPGPDEAAAESARSRSRGFTAMRGGLGRLDEIAEWLANWSGRKPAVSRPLVALFAGTHGATSHGIAERQAIRTVDLVELCASGGAAVSQVCGAENIGLKVFDLALDLPTGDSAVEAAMEERDCAATMAFGMEAVAGGSDLIAVGALGVGGTTVAATMLAALFGGEPSQWLPGGGNAALDGRREAFMTRALDTHWSHLGDPLEVLRRVGGREFAALAGAILAARIERVPVILDGFAATAAAAVLAKLTPGALDHCLLAQLAPGAAHSRAAHLLGLRPLLDLSLAHGEGVGGALAIAVAKQAAAIHAGMGG